jgi:uncharacterized protein
LAIKNAFDVTRAEAATPAQAQERADGLRDQFIMDMHTHFLRDDTRIQTFVRQREAVGKAGWNPQLVGKPQTIEDLKWNNYFKEVFLDSDTKVALISSAPSDVPQDWFLTNEMAIAARDRVNREAGSRRMMAHAIFTPGQPGWLEALEAALAARPDSIKGYTIGDNTNKDISKYPWRMDDEQVTYRAYELCVHDCARISGGGDFVTGVTGLATADPGAAGQAHPTTCCSWAKHIDRVRAIAESRLAHRKCNPHHAPF